MNGSGDRWALVLAAGDGTRLRSLTATGDGGHVPKQFCSFCSDRSLLAQTIGRAERLVSRERVVVVVAARHRELWEPELADLPAENVVVQPQNLGTGNGVLLGAMAIAQRDTAATLLILPSDHAFENERRLRIALRRAQLETIRHPRDLVLLGIEPDEPDTEYGWIVPARAGEGLTSGVAGFVEKPDALRAARLMAEGAVWSSFIMAARLAALLALYQRGRPEILRAFGEAFGAAGPALGPSVDRLYEDLPHCDFSRDLLQRGIGSLRLMRVPELGWSDLGTPERLLRLLRQRRLRRAAALHPALAAGRA
ncbi:MAG TPA: sugar phosphate nucleotidyltransferase, partial [Planctomycetota bacterium]|nr:sugar phosphate nucleotidyltransferase [Planctomycetota bacterium]